MKKIIPLLFLFIFCLISCGKNEENKVQTVSPTDEENARIIWYYQEEKSAYEKPVPAVETEGVYGILRDFYETENGDIYFLYQEDLTPEQENNYYRINGPRTDVEYENHIIRYNAADHSFEDIKLETDRSIFWTDIRVSGNGTIILFDTQRAYVYLSGEEQCKADFPADPRGGTIFQDDEHLICQPMMESAYMIFDLRTGEKTEDYISREFLYEGITNGGSFLVRNQETELLATGNGIYEKEGEEWILKASSERTSMTLGGFRPDGLWKEGEEYFLTAGTVLYHYSLAEINLDEMVELKIFSVAESSFLKNAVLEYRTANPNVSITYEFAGSKAPANSQEMDTLYKRVNSEMVSSQAADIYVFDNLPWEGYARQGMLLDIDETVKTLLDTGEYFDGVLKGYQEEEATFVMPLFFEADCIVCRKETVPYVKSLSSLANHLKEHPDEAGLVPYSYRGNAKDLFLPMLYHFYGSELYEDGKVTKERLESFLKEAMILYDRLMSEEVAEVRAYQLDYKNYDLMEEEFWQLLGCGKGNVSLAVLGRLGVWLFPQISHYEEFEIIPTGQFHSGMLAGVHSQTEYPKEACEFLQFLASYAGTFSEKSSVIPGIPVARQTVDVWIEFYEETCRERWGYDREFYYSPTYGEGYPLYYPIKEDSMWLKELLDKAVIPRGYASSLTDSTYAILEQGIDGYFEGEKSLETTVDELYSRISIKQSEEE